MHEIATPRQSQGSIKVVGKAHGSLNCIVVPADGSPWYFKQFVTEEELHEFVDKFNLITVQGDQANG